MLSQIAKYIVFMWQYVHVTKLPSSETKLPTLRHHNYCYFQNQIYFQKLMYLQESKLLRQLKEV